MPLPLLFFSRDRGISRVWLLAVIVFLPSCLNLNSNLSMYQVSGVHNLNNLRYQRAVGSVFYLCGSDAIAHESGKPQLVLFLPEHLLAQIAFSSFFFFFFPFCLLEQDACCLLPYWEFMLTRKETNRYLLFSKVLSDIFFSGSECLYKPWQFSRCGDKTNLCLYMVRCK